MKRRSFRQFCRDLGPGVITGAADDDPSGIATYSMAGAQFGTSLLWMAVISWPLMAAVQSMCARIGMVTGKGLMAALRHRFPRKVLIGMSFALATANVINIGADLSGMADAAELLTGIDSHMYVVVFGAAIAAATVWLRYVTLANTLKWLALVLIAYVVTAFMVGPHWPTVARDTFVPRLPDISAWGMIVAILGTTISPYLFFWQASQEVEEEKAAGRVTAAERRGATEDEMSLRRWDIGAGTLVSNSAMFFIMLTTALTLHANGITNLTSSREVAQALEPLAGRWATLLYAVGLIGTGALAIPTLAGSASYAFSELFGWRQGIDESFRNARAFYVSVIVAVLAGVAMDFANISAIKAMYWSAIVNGLFAPFLLIGILLVASDRKIMQGQPSSRLSLGVVGLTMVAMFGAAIAMFVV
ncbi:MAG: divalent metal cation transporter [Phycisphaerae bacterium]|nr:divalent metal cation transporter [Gemmatimonadaceae bacterium]